MTHLFIHIEIAENDRIHDHKILYTTNCKNLNFAVLWYVTHYWGYAERMLNMLWFHGEIAIKTYNWKKIPKKDFKILKKYL